MHLADALSKATYSVFRLIFDIFYQYVFPWDWTHNLCAATQCSTTEPQEHYITVKDITVKAAW